MKIHSKISLILKN